MEQCVLSTMRHIQKAQKRKQVETPPEPERKCPLSEVILEVTRCWDGAQTNWRLSRFSEPARRADHSRSISYSAVIEVIKDFCAEEDIDMKWYKKDRSRKDPLSTNPPQLMPEGEENFHALLSRLVEPCIWVRVSKKTSSGHR